MSRQYPYYGAPVGGQAHIVLRSFAFYQVDIKWKGEAPQCCICKGKIEPQSQMIMREIQVSYMRGDDEIEFYHKKCWKKRKAKSNDTRNSKTE